MRRKKLVKVTRGDLEATAETKRAAQALLDPQIDWACSYRSAVIEKRLGWIIAVTPTCHGWEWRAFWPLDFENGQQAQSVTFSHEQDRDEILQEARLHVATAVWRHEKDADEIVASAGLSKRQEARFRDWVEWQRKYKLATERGAAPNEAHRIASGLVPMPAPAVQSFAFGDQDE